MELFLAFYAQHFVDNASVAVEKYLKLFLHCS